MKKRSSRRIAGLLCLCLCLTAWLVLSSCGGSEPIRQNGITSVRLSESRGSRVVSVYASLTDDTLEDLAGDVYLFELPSDRSDTERLDQLSPLASTKAKRNVRFRLDLMDGTRSRLYSSFLLAARDPDTGRYTALTSPVAIPDAGTLADAPAAPTAERSLKGLISATPADAIRTGIAYTLVDVPMEELLLERWAADAVSYTWNGTTYYLQAAALQALDDTINAYTIAGVRVYLRFTLGWNTSGRAPSCLYFPGVVAGATGYAVHMGDPTAARTMEGFFDFLADRYTDPDGPGRLLCRDFILGKAVNEEDAYVASADATYSEHVANYEKLVRLAHTALTSHAADGRIFISLDSHLSGRDSGRGWGIQRYLPAFRDQATASGEYDWNVACELFADRPDAWVADPTVDADRLTVHSLSTLTDTLAGETYLSASGARRALVVSRCHIPSVTSDGTAAPNMQSAAYAFAYLTALANGHVEALIYDALASTADADGGALCALTPALSPRPVYDTFLAVDTANARDDVAPAVRETIGAVYEQLERAVLGFPSPMCKLSGSVNVQATAPGKKAVSLSCDGAVPPVFSNAGHLSYVENTIRLSGTDSGMSATPYLHARFDRDLPGGAMGMATTLSAEELKGAKQLFLDLSVIPSDGAAVPSVTVVLTRPSKGDVAKGDGALLYQATAAGLSGNVWQTISFDISDFADALDAGDEVTLTIRLEADRGTAFDLNLRSMQVTGTRSGAPTTTIVVIVAAALAVAVIATVVALAIRKRKHP